jgi:hypothetical protein
MDNVTTLVPREHWAFDIWEVKEGYLAECHKNGDLLWEYKSNSLTKVMVMVNKTIGHMDDSRL